MTNKECIERIEGIIENYHVEPPKDQDTLYHAITVLKRVEALRAWLVENTRVYPSEMFDCGKDAAYEHVLDYLETGEGL